MGRHFATVVWLAVVSVLIGAAGAQAASVYTTRSSFPGQVYQLAVAANGELSLRSPESVSAGQLSYGIGITPEGGNVYVTNAGAKTLNQYAVSAAGLLSPLTPPTVPVSENDFPIAISPDGSSLYTAHSSSEIEQFTIGAGGALAAKTPPTVSTGGSDDIVLSPDGRYLYASNFGFPGLIYEYEVQAGGTLKALSPPSVSAGSFPVGMAVTPDGHNLYAGTESASGILQFTIGPDGGLTPMTPPNVTMPPETNTEHLVVSPDGASLYSSDLFKGGVVQLAIGANGALSPLTPPKVTEGTKTSSVAVSPDGRSLYVGRYTGEELQRFAIGVGGTLTPTSNLIPATGVANDIAVSPDRGPTAALWVFPALAGTPTSFDASGSTDPDGQVVRYDWSFGDGASGSTSTPTTTHAYERPGDYTAAVKVTDNEGASTGRVFTGHQVLLNGSPAAQATRSFQVAAPPTVGVGAALPKLSNLQIRPKRFAVGNPDLKRRAKGPHRGAYVSFELDIAGTVAEQVQRRVTGHRGKSKCSIRSKRGKRCGTWKSLKGSFSIAGIQGANRLPFTGRVQRSKLLPGTYRLVLMPQGAGRGGPSAYARFTILPG